MVKLKKLLNEKTYNKGQITKLFKEFDKEMGKEYPKELKGFMMDLVKYPEYHDKGIKLIDTHKQKLQNVYESLMDKFVDLLEKAGHKDF